jgi:hypothetical protein
MRPKVSTVRTLTKTAAVSAVACALLGTGAMTAHATPGSQTSGDWQDQGWNGSHQDQGHRPASQPTPVPKPTPAPRPTPPPKPTPAPKPAAGGEQDGQWPPAWSHQRPQPPVTGTRAAAHLAAAQPAPPPKAPPAPHPATAAHHPDTTPVTGPGLGSSPAVVLALAASAPLAGIGARIGGIGGVVPLPGWGSLRSSLLSGGPAATGVLGAIVLAGSTLLGLGAYACTRLRRMLARRW